MFEGMHHLWWRAGQTCLKKSVVEEEVNVSRVVMEFRIQDNACIELKRFADQLRSGLNRTSSVVEPRKNAKLVMICAIQE
jgi:hypothetical protein